MDVERVRLAASRIETNTKALRWLEEHGTKITGRDKSEARVEVDLRFAGSCPGANEAVSVIEAFALIGLPDLIQTAIRNCRNTIELEREAIVSAARSPEGGTDAG